MASDQHPHTGDLRQLRQFFADGIGRSDDFRQRDFKIGGDKGPTALLVYLDGMIDRKMADEQVLAPLMAASGATMAAGGDTMRVIWDSLASSVALRSSCDLNAAQTALLDGEAALFVDGCARFLLLSIQSFPHRAIGSPTTENSVRGARDAFTELLSINVILVRRRAKHPNLRVHYRRVGSVSGTQVAVISIEGLTNPEILRTVMKRIEAIDIDQVQESHTLESFLKDHPFTPFPLIRPTERPDEAVRTLISGKVLILTDGTPFVLAVPAIAMDFYQTMEDYTFGSWGATFIRLLRLLGWALATFLPALYIALIAVNPELLPNELALTIAAAREGLPFPPIIEVLIIEVLIELVREAGLRLPQPLGSTIGIVGGVVIGQAIVAAGVISPLMIIFAAVTMLASFTTPVIDMGFPWRILKWPLIILANLFGLLGVILGTSAIFAHLVSLSSFGVPFMSPFSPLQVGDLADTAVRAPLYSFRKRPAHLRTLDETKSSGYDQPVDHPQIYPPYRRAGREEEER